MLTKIKLANIVWYSRITPEGDSEFLEIPRSINYPNLIQGSFFLAFRDEHIDFIDAAYENRVNFEQFLKLLDGALLVEGELQRENDGFRILVQKKYDYNNWYVLLRNNKLASYSSFLRKKCLYGANDFIDQLNKEENYFRMISVCKDCNMPEDESDFIWLVYEGKEWWVRLWIHNNGNMWTAHFVL